MVEARIAASFASLPADWCAAARAQSLYLDAPYLRYASRDHGRVFRAEVRAEGVLRAGLTGWLAHGSGHPYLEPRKLLQLPASAEPDLVLGCPGAFTGDMLVEGAADADSAAALASALTAHARELGAGSVLALYASDVGLTFWSQLGATHAPALINFDTVIDVPPSFDEWFRRLPRKRRSSIGRELRAFEQAGFRSGVALASEVELPALLLELSAILVASEARFGNALEEEGVVGTLERQRELLGDAFAVFYVRDPAGRLVAGATAFLDDVGVHMRWGGVDRDNAGRNLEYFHVAYYEPIRFAAASGRSRVRLGMESFEAKLLRGAHLEPRWALPLTLVAGWEERAERASSASMNRLAGLLARFPECIAADVHARLQPGAAFGRMRA